MWLQQRRAMGVGEVGVGAGLGRWERVGRSPPPLVVEEAEEEEEEGVEWVVAQEGVKK